MTDEQKKALYDDAFKNEEQNGGCCQCVLSAINTHFGNITNNLFQAATAMAAGVGKSGSACGACTGAILSIGTFIGRDFENFSTEKGQELKANSTELARKIVSKFEEEYGGIECRCVQEKVYGRSYIMSDTNEYEAFLEAGGHGPNGCTKVVAKAAVWAAEVLEEAGLIK